MQLIASGSETQSLSRPAAKHMSQHVLNVIVSDSPEKKHVSAGETHHFHQMWDEGRHRRMWWVLHLVSIFALEESEILQLKKERRLKRTLNNNLLLLLFYN